MEEHLMAYKTFIEANYDLMPHTGDVADQRYKFSIEFEPGKKFIKVVHLSYGGNRAVHSFIVNVKNDPKFKYGDILKAASWKAPAKNFARGNIFNPETYQNHRWSGI